MSNFRVKQITIFDKEKDGAIGKILVKSGKSTISTVYFGDYSDGFSQWGADAMVMGFTYKIVERLFDAGWNIT